MKLSDKEVKRANIISKYTSGIITLKMASSILNISERQVSRLSMGFIKSGINYFVHGNTGRSPSNKTPLEVEQEILKYYRINCHMIPSVPYFKEKLIEDKVIEEVPSMSTLRRILKDSGLGRSYGRKKTKQYKKRESSHREGSLLQLDGSYHKWFGNKESCVISVVDDATSKIVAAKFCQSETTMDCFDLLNEIIEEKGKPEIIFTDRAGVYSSRKREGFSSVEKALYELDIVPLFAYSPQSKGKVERHFRTLQEWLVADLAWRNIRTIEEANKYLKEVFIDKYNNRFGKQPLCLESAYRKNNQELHEILCKNDYRVIGNGDSFSYNNNQYIVKGNWNNLKKRKVQIKQYMDGNKKYFVDGIQVEVEVLKLRKSV